MKIIIQNISFFIIVIFAAIPSAFAGTFHIKPNMTDQINLMIENANPGDTIYFDSGKYMLSHTIFIHKKHSLTLIAGENSEFILKDKKTIVFLISSSDNILLKNIKARHIKPIYPGQYCSGEVVSVYESHDVEIINAELNGSGTIGVDITNSLNIRISDSYLHHNTVAAISLTGLTDGIIIENNRIINNPKFLETKLTKDQLEKYVVFKNNTFE